MVTSPLGQLGFQHPWLIGVLHSQGDPNPAAWDGDPNFTPETGFFQPLSNPSPCA